MNVNAWLRANMNKLISEVLGQHRSETARRGLQMVSNLSWTSPEESTGEETTTSPTENRVSEDAEEDIFGDNAPDWWNDGG